MFHLFECYGRLESTFPQCIRKCNSDCVILPVRVRWKFVYLILYLVADYRGADKSLARPD